ncbi:hypothetical protein FLM48_03730 [Shewanella sp. Scap07]|uniref:hypothetical protein n=1 Tax=Shewanella sp. Scap07 TaxID=2589987 RepID=UPI0015BD091D|nr:hypothetical protein [Shewanella sp. Scap07]QLE84274.1 hypothetical protein FLM48_03730 [Shewanella sp. Scap07]
MKSKIANCMKIVGLALVFSAANASPDHVSSVNYNVGIGGTSNFVQNQLEENFSLYSPEDDGPVILHCKPWPDCELHQPQSFTY